MGLEDLKDAQEFAYKSRNVADSLPDEYKQIMSGFKYLASKDEEEYRVGLGYIQLLFVTMYGELQELQAKVKDLEIKLNN